MKPILFEATETQFLSNGLGRIDAISCTVTEERNGQYELEMEVSIDDPHYAEIKEGRILYVRHDETQDKQPFDIYNISRPLNGIVTVLAHHVSYRTAKITVAPFTASGIGLTLTAIPNNAIGENPFTFWTDKVVSTTFNLEYPKTMRSLLAGEQGSLLDVFGTGEYEWDKFTIKLHLHRGSDSGVVLRYGKDLIDLKKTTDISDIWTGVVPYWRGTPEGGNSEVTVMLTEKYIASPYATSFEHEMLIPLDLSSTFEGMPSEQQLREAAQRYVTNNAIGNIPANIEFSFINLASLDEYKNVTALQRLKLCDTVTVIYDKLGVSNTAKIIQTVFDVLTEKYVNMTIGEVASNLDTALMGGIKGELDDLKNSTKQDLNKTRNALEQKLQDSIDEQTELITGGTGGYVVLKRDGDGKPTEILIMDNPDMNQALQVLRINVDGIGFSSEGINGPYTSAWTLDGHFNASFITTGELNAALVKVGALTDVSGNNYWNMETGEFRLASTTKIGEENTTDTLSSLFDEKATIYYGIFRTGSYSNYSPPSNSETPLANGDMRQDGSTTYICTDARYGTWTKFTEATIGDYFVDKYTGSTYQWNGTTWNKVTDYKSAISDYDSSLNQTAVFNRLTNNGTIKGIFMKDGELYCNASYIQSGTLKLGGLDNVNGQLEIKNASGTVIGKWNKDGITVNSGSINIGDGNFIVDTTGKMTCTGASITGGAIESSGTVNSLSVKRTMSVASDSFMLSGTKVLDSAWRFDDGYEAYNYRQIIYGNNGYAITLGNDRLDDSSGLFIAKNTESAHKAYVRLRSKDYMAVVEGYTATLSSNDTSEGFLASVTAKKDTVDLGCAKLTVNSNYEGRTVNITIDGTDYHFEKGILTAAS